MVRKMPTILKKNSIVSIATTSHSLKVLIELNCVTRKYPELKAPIMDIMNRIGFIIICF